MRIGGVMIAPYRWRSEEPVHLLTLALSARPRKPISRQLANPRMKPARGEIPQVMPMRKPSYRISTQKRTKIKKYHEGVDAHRKEESHRYGLPQ